VVVVADGGSDTSRGDVLGKLVQRQHTTSICHKLVNYLLKPTQLLVLFGWGCSPRQPVPSDGNEMGIVRAVTWSLGSDKSSTWNLHIAFYSASLTLGASLSKASTGDWLFGLC
jgi:hypothetical protein